MNLLARAYSGSYRIDGPGWPDTERYDVVAKMSPETTADEFRTMLRNMLAERFGLKAHHEAREFRAHDLIVTKAGPNLKEAAPTDPNASPGATSGPVTLDQYGFPQLTQPGMTTMNTFVNGVPVARLTARAQPISRLVVALRAALQEPVQDKTGLTGKYDFTLEYALGGAMAASSPSPSGNAPDAEIGFPTIAYAIKSLGLALQDTRTTLDVLVVDHAEKVPTEN
jgi:uncharacterized protein (TIGR03435 family)